MTPHISAKKDEIAKVVIMPGDPLRAKWIAQKYLTNPKLVNEVRGMLAYTGTYNGYPVTVMGSGMGIPSIGIYSHELFCEKFYDVDVIMRVGSAGAWAPELEVGSIVVATKAWSDSRYSFLIGLEENRVFHADPSLIELAKKTSNTRGDKVVFDLIYSSETFQYGAFDIATQRQRTGGAVCSEMESHGLYACAKRNGKQAISFLAISDNVPLKQHMSSQEREQGLGKMVELALDTAVNYYKSK